MNLIDREDHSTTQLIIPQNAIQKIILEKALSEYPDLKNKRKPTIRFIDGDGKEIKANFMCDLYYNEGAKGRFLREMEKDENEKK